MAIYTNLKAIEKKLHGMFESSNLLSTDVGNLYDVIVRDGSNINDIRDIYNKKVAVQLGSVADQYFSDKYPNTSLVRQKKYLSMVEDLKANKVDLIVMDELPAKEIVRANNGLKIIDGYVFEDSYGIAVKKGNSELLKAINVVLERLISEGKIDEYVLRFTR